jgi:hypothetical protein
MNHLEPVSLLEERRRERNKTEENEEKEPLKTTVQQRLNV